MKTAHLYDEMIESVGDEILQLIKEGKNLSDMVIISPINNSILDYKISNKLKQNNLQVKNTK